MPIYEYECTQCGQIEEIIQRLAEKPLTACKHCSGKLQKLISQSTFHLKGTGWYVTDYAKKPTSATVPPKQKADSSAKGATGDSSSAHKKKPSKSAAAKSA